jgi:hypothetical protein
MKNSVLMRSINTLYFRQNNSLILKLTSGQRKYYITVLGRYGLFCGGREKVGKSKMLIFQGNDSKFHIIPKIL